MNIRSVALVAGCILPSMIVSPLPGANAQTRHVVGPAMGLTCMSLIVTDRQAMDPAFVVPLYAEPSPNAPAVGRASATVFVRSPVVEQNGFLEAMLFNGKVGWISARAVKPWKSLGNTGERCVPSKMSDGSLGLGS
jgi:hypothetical protein